MMRMVMLAAVIILLRVTAAHACDAGTVRDAAFHSTRDNFWMGMVFDNEDVESQARYDALVAWLDDAGAGLNLHAEHILPEDAMYLRMRYGVSEAPSETPVTVFSGRHPAEPRPIPFLEWTPAPELSLLEDLKTNATLAAVSRDALAHWAVIVYARGAGVERRDAIDAVVAQWRRNHAPGVVVHELDRRAPENAFLCAVAGINEDGEDWAGIVFSRGRLLLPTLVGDAISERELDRLLNRLMVPCTCLQQATTFGFDLPMFWEEDYAQRYINLDAPMGYMEMPLGDKLASIYTEMPSGQKTLNTVAFTTLSLLGLVAVLALSVVYVRLRSR